MQAQLPFEIAGGRYRLEAHIGSGGTATVYQAWDTAFEMPCAVKVISGEVRVRKALRKRLHAEARAMIRLKHANILRLYDIGVHGDRDYVVMELAEGGTLGMLLRQHGPLPPRLALNYTLQILDGLAVAHQKGIIHRDIKPDNVLLNLDGSAMLGDFGIAMLTEDTLRSTKTNVTMGSLAFMPPEQRLDARSVTETADLYAVGATLYNILTNRNPIDLFTANRSSERWTAIPPYIVRILQRSTQMEPADRYPSAETFIADIRAIID
ncbi:MAG: serine/threonine-protein kinase, partial [Myxococcota bacterium]